MIDPSNPLKEIVFKSDAWEGEVNGCFEHEIGSLPSSSPALAQMCFNAKRTASSDTSGEIQGLNAGRGELGNRTSC